MKRPKIVDIRATTVAVPIEAPIRHSNGAHWGKFVRTIVEVETNTGIIGLGEMGGGGQSAEAAFTGLKDYLVGHDPFEFEALWFKICNPTASLYNNRTQLHAAIEFACLDIVGKTLGIPFCDILGGKLRDEVSFASYLFFRYNDKERGGEVRTAEQLIGEAKRMKNKYGFSSHKLKAGVFPPDYELEVYRAMAESLPGDSVRYDPNAAHSVEDAIRFGHGIEDLRNDFFEDPTWGLNGMRRVREAVRIPTATNTVVINFEQLATNVLNPSCDVILLDTTFWGGIRPCIKAAQICDAFQLGIAVHSSGELGIQLATMLHLGAVLPNLVFTADAHYHHLMDDIIVGGLMPYDNGKIKVPTKPGLGVELDRDKLHQYSEYYKQHGGYPYDRDPGRKEWFSLVPNTRWADPTVSIEDGTLA